MVFSIIPYTDFASVILTFSMYVLCNSRTTRWTIVVGEREHIVNSQKFNCVVDIEMLYGELNMKNRGDKERV